MIENIQNQPVSVIETKISHPTGNLTWVTHFHLADIPNHGTLLAVVLDSSRQIPLGSNAKLSSETFVQAYWNSQGYLAIAAASENYALEFNIAPGVLIQLHIS